MTVGIRALSYRFGSRTVGLEDLAEQGLLGSTPETLRGFGFDRVHIAEPGEDLGCLAASDLLREHEVDPLEIDALIVFGGLPPDPVSVPEGEEATSLFHYPAGRLQHALGLTRATAFGMGQQGCAAVLSALRVARSLLLSGDARNVLCVGIDIVPAGVRREVIYNVLSDGACAMLVSTPWPRLRPVAFRQITKGYYWDTSARRDEIIAAYFPTARNAIRDVVAAAGLTLDDVALVVPDNVSRRGWEILLGLLGIPEERAFLGAAAVRGHAITADLVVNLRDAIDARDLAPESPIAMFTFGFGANWGAAVLRA
ncbi:MAG TPA: 3-oxoacyl-[acyl-carrier-protein] synthase III C-terminal domain-containing protein [Actinomycetota bacterium]|nr:3-oxoacyl-[acyl-carrier-protein] synthase III C-terminal domain-containing protein [Actinomycetota bacterium]